MMFIDFRFSEPWHSENEKVKISLGLPENISVRIYPNTFSALYDLGVGTCQFFSHKRSVLIQKGVHPFAGIFQGQFLRETYNVQMFSSELLTVDVATTVEGLKKDTVLGILFKNHLVTGEQYDFAAVESALNAKKIYSIYVDHSYKNGIQVPQPFSTYIYPINENCSVAVIGDRFKTPALFAPHIYSKISLPPKLARESQFDLGRNQKIIEALETKLPSGYQSFFKDSNVNRLTDRLVIYHEQISADVTVTELLSEGLDCWTMNLCHQDTVDFRSSWWEPEVRSEIKRGLVAVSLEKFAQNKFERALANAANLAPLRWKF